MNSMTLGLLRLGLVPLVLVASTAMGGDGVAVTITNDSVDPILVTVYDTSVSPSAVVLSHARINGFTSIPVSVMPDATGRANLSWTAVSTDANERRCGHQEGVALGDSASISVHADSSSSV
jgi:hypothetical protein